MSSFLFSSYLLHFNCKFVAQKKAIHHVLKRTCFLARFQKGKWKTTSLADRMTKLERTIGATRTVLRPYLGTRSAVVFHVSSVTVSEIKVTGRKFSPSHFLNYTFKTLSKKLLVSGCCG